MPFGRRAIQSNVIALFMLQQRGQIPSLPTALRHALTGGATFKVLSDVVRAECRSEGRHVPFLAHRLANKMISRMIGYSAEAGDPLAYAQAFRRHDRDRAAIASTWRRSDGSGVGARRLISRRFRRAFGGYFCKRSAVLVEPGILACKGLPTKYSDIYVGWINLDRETGATGHLRCDDGGAGSAEWLIHGLAR
jgi:hypothetical protein